MRTAYKKRLQALEREGKRGYNPPHRDWQRPTLPPENPVSRP